ILPIRNAFEDLTPLSGLTGLTEVDLISSQLADLSPLASLSQLDTLAIESNKVTDISSLAGLDTLTDASFTSNGLTDLTDFKQWKNLEKLYLETPNVTNIKPLDQLEGLTSLHLNRVRDLDWSPIGKLTNLQSLQFDYAGNIDLSFTADLLSLETLVVPSSGITDISPLANLVALNKLYLYNNSITDVSVLANKTSLTNLLLHKNQIEDISPLFNLKQMTKLQVNHNRVKEIIPAHAGQVDLSHLSELVLQRNVIESTASVLNADFSALQWLNLQENAIDNLSGLETLSNLKTLVLDDNLITDLTRLSGLGKLETLSLSNNLFSDLSPLYGLTNLKKVYVRNNPNLSCEQIELLKANVSATVESNCNNILPTIDAGPDQTVEEQTEVALFANAQDSDGSIRTTYWQQTQGPIVSLIYVDILNRKFIAPVVTEQTELVFKMGAKDWEHGTVWDTVSVTVNPVNAPPLVFAGEDQLLDSQALVTLSALASDIDGSINSVSWQQTGGTAVTLDNANSTSATFTAPSVRATEILTFTVYVTDNEQSVASDKIIVSINPSSD
ncbi:MAG: hypothetical protein MJK04_23055, partial [Psychrosphaera sp.]|nr:hypothetical protein [Psychrosphaera sp.]